MSYERCFGGFAGHNVDRRLWVGVIDHNQFTSAVFGCATTPAGFGVPGGAPWRWCR
jgi:hypothetical protein